MNRCRIFISQGALDTWIFEGRVEIDGDELYDTATRQRFRLREGVRFLAEVSGAPDVAKLVGKVKDLEQVANLSGEHMADSVILGDNAYAVQPGFVGTPLVATVPSTSDAPDPHKNTIEALQAFFLNNVK